MGERVAMMRGQLNAREAAAYLSYSRAQFNALVEAGRLPATNEEVPGHPRWSVKALDAWMTQKPERDAADAQAAERQRAREAIAGFKPKIRRAHAEQAR